MAYAVTIDSVETESINGNIYTIYEVTESDVGAADEFTLGIPEFCTLELYEGELTVAGAATTIDTDMGLVAAFLNDTLDAVVQNETAAAYLRNQTDVKIAASAKQLIVRSTPDGQATEIKHRITIRNGV